MAESTETITKKLDYHKIILPLLLGLGVAAYLLISNLNEVKYTRVTEGTGDYVIARDPDFPPDEITDENTTWVGEGKGNYVREKARDNLSKITWSWHLSLWLFLALIAMVFRDLGYMIRLRTLTDKQFNWKQTFRVVMLWEFASSLSPSVVGGSSIAMFIINREGISMGKSTAIVLITAILDEIFYITMVPLVFIAIGPESLFPAGLEQEVFGFTVGPRIIFWLGYVFILILVLVFGTAIFFRPRLFKYLLVKMFSWRILRRWRQLSLDTGNEIMEASKEYRNKPPRFWISVLASTYFSWISRFIVVNFLIIAFVTGLDQMLIFGRQIVMWVILLISPTPGGAGVAELAFSGFMGDLIPFGFAGILALLWRLLSYYPYLFIGALILPGWIRKTADNEASIFN